jgi:hypothetical protein
MTQSSIQIGFDITQKERGRIFSNYQGLRALLENGANSFAEISEFPLTFHTLQNYTIIFFTCPDSSRLTPDEIAALLEYVSEGGHLVLLNHAGGDQGRRTNLGAITEPFGIAFNNDEVLDPVSNLGVDAYPLITHLQEHPILHDVADFCYRIGCSLTISKESLPLAFTSKSAAPPNKPVLGLIQYGAGSILASGSYEMFQDNVKGGISYTNNAQLIRNIIIWFSKSSDSQKDSSTPHKSSLKDSLPLNPSPSTHRHEISLPNTKISKLSKELKQLAIDVTTIKDEHESILTDSIAMKEKLNIFELNMREFPSDLLSELNIEVEGNITKIKSHSKAIAQLTRDITAIRKRIEKIERILENPAPSSQLSPSPKTEPTSQKPLIVTAAELIGPPKEAPSVIENPKVKAYQQMLQLLTHNFQEGLLTPEEYHTKREKYEKKLTQLQGSVKQ